MNHSLARSAGKEWVLWILLAIAIIAAAWLRISYLDADPPMYFDGYGQSLSTDPYQYTFHARNKILFGDSDPLKEDKWRVFEFTLVSGLSYLVFSISGISRSHANLVGVLLSLSAIILFIISIRKISGLKGALIAAIFLLFNKVLFIYGRLPFLENGLLFWLALLFFIFVYFRQYFWGKIAIGILIALAGLSGKMFGFIGLIPVVAAFWIEDRQRIWKNSVIIIASLLATAVLWFFVIYGGSIRLLAEYLFQQTIGLYGFPDALRSPLAFFEKLINFGNDSLFYSLAPALGVAGFIGLFSIIGLDRKRYSESFCGIIFLAIWFAAGQLFFMIGNYRPLRYEYMLYFPLAGLAGFAFTQDLESHGQLEKSSRILISLFLFLLVWIFLEQIVYGLFRVIGFSETYEKKSAQTVWITLIPAVAVTFLELKFKRLRNALSQISVRTILLGVLMILGLFDFGISYSTWQEQRSYIIREAGQDLGEILNKNAIITGPMAPTLLLENGLRGMIYAVGISKDEPDLFKKYPATHFAIDVESSQKVTSEFPQLEDAKLIADYWVRDDNVGVYKIWEATGNVIAEKYIPTDYETGCKFIDSGQYDSAQVYIERFLDLYPSNKSALKVLSDIYSFQGEIIAGLGVLKTACELYPRDFSLLFSKATTCQKIFVTTNDDQYRRLALEDFRAVLKLNPYQADEIESVTRNIANFNSKNTK